MSKIQKTNDIRKESSEPQMTAETYRFAMSWDHYPEPETGDRHVELRLHTRIPDFSVLNWQNGIPCFPAYGPTVFTQNEPIPGAGFCAGNGYGEKTMLREGNILPKKRWQTRSSRAVWKRRAKRNKRKERAQIRLATFPTVPEVCVSCRDIMEKKSCKLPEQGMGSLCSTYLKNHKKIITPANREQSPYPGSLRQKLDQFEKRNRPAKIWRVSTLPTINRNDGNFIRYDTNKAGELFRIYRDSDPKLVPEIAFGHDRTEDSSGYDECAFPDDWRMDLIDSSGNDDTVFMDINDHRDIKKQCFEMPKPNWVSVTRTRRVICGFETYYTNDTHKELNRVWHWNPETHKFTFTLEEREVTTRVRRDIAIMRSEEYPTLINVSNEEQFEKELKMMSGVTGDSMEELRVRNTILVQSSTVVTRSERNFYSAKREIERQKRVLTGYLIIKDAKEGIAMAPKHKWPVRSKRAAAPMVQVPVPMER